MMDFKSLPQARDCHNTPPCFKESQEVECTDPLCTAEFCSETCLLKHLNAVWHHTYTRFLYGRILDNSKSPLVSFCSSDPPLTRSSWKKLHALLNANDVNQVDEDGNTPLYFASVNICTSSGLNVRSSAWHLAETLLEKKANPSIQNRDGVTSFDILQYKKKELPHNSSTLNILLAKFLRADPSLHGYFLNKLTDLKELESRISPQTINDKRDGWTALHLLCCDFRHRKTPWNEVKLLLESKANPYLTTPKGETARDLLSHESSWITTYDEMVKTCDPQLEEKTAQSLIQKTENMLSRVEYLQRNMKENPHQLSYVTETEYLIAYELAKKKQSELQIALEFIRSHAKVILGTKADLSLLKNIRKVLTNPEIIKFYDNKLHST
jgi:hypothetical protein